MFKKKIIISCLTFGAAVLSACGGNNPSPSVTPTSLIPETSVVSVEDPSEVPAVSERQGTKATISFSATGGGATISYEKELSEYYEGDTVKFNLSTKEGFTLDAVKVNNKEVTPAEEGEFLYSFVAKANNSIKVTLITDFVITGEITFNGKKLTKDQSSMIGIKAVDANGTSKEGTITYDETSAVTSYEIKNVSCDTEYDVVIVGYEGRRKSGAFDFCSYEASVIDSSLTFNVDVATKYTDSTTTISYPVSGSAFAQIFNYEDTQHRSLFVDNYAMVISFNTKLSQHEATANNAVGDVIALYYASEANNENGSFTYRILYQDVATSPDPTKSYKIQDCTTWQTFSFQNDAGFELTDIENGDFKLVFLCLERTMEVYVVANNRYFKTFTYNVSFRQSHKYVDNNAWSESSICDCDVNSVTIYSGVSSITEVSPDFVAYDA